MHSVQFSRHKKITVFGTIMMDNLARHVWSSTPQLSTCARIFLDLFQNVTHYFLGVDGVFVDSMTLAVWLGLLDELIRVGVRVCVWTPSIHIYKAHTSYKANLSADVYEHDYLKWHIIKKYLKQ
jgi:hypothetical protein